MKEEPGSAIQSRAEHRIDFYGDPLMIGLAGERKYVLLRSFTEFLGRAWSSQVRCVNRDEILASRVQGVVLTGADGR